MSCLISLSSPARTEEGSWDEHAEGRQYCALGAGPAPGVVGGEGVGILKVLVPTDLREQKCHPADFPLCTYNSPHSWKASPSQLGEVEFRAARFLATVSHTAGSSFVLRAVTGRCQE